jgi:hypothetical protein
MVTKENIEEDILDKHMGDLLSHVDVIQKTRERSTTSKTVNPIRKQYNQFKRAYSLLNIEEKTDLIARFYKVHSKLIENQKARNWGNANASLIIDPDDTGMRLNMSVFWRNANTIMKDTEDELKGLPDSAADTRIELVFPDLLELYLYRVICEVIDSPATVKVLTNIEEDLGEEISNGPPPTAKGGSSTAPDLSGMPPMMQQFMGMATDMFKNIGQNAGGQEGVQGVSSVLDSIGKAMADTDNTSKISDVIGQIQTTPPNQLMDKMKDLYNDPELQRMAKAVMDPNLSPDLASNIIASINGGNVPAEGDVPVVTDGFEEASEPATLTNEVD